MSCTEQQYRTEQNIVYAKRKTAMRYHGAKIFDTNEPINFYISRMSLEIEIICGSHTQQSPANQRRGALHKPHTGSTKIELINYKWICVQSQRWCQIKSTAIFRPEAQWSSTNEWNEQTDEKKRKRRRQKMRLWEKELNRHQIPFGSSQEILQFRD